MLDSSLLLQEQSVYEDDYRHWMKVCFGNCVNNDDYDTPHVLNARDNIDNKVVNDSCEVEDKEVNEGGAVTINDDSRGSHDNEHHKTKLMEQVEKDSHLINLCKTVDSWISMMLLAKSNSRTGKYVQPSEVIDIKWPLLSKLLIALLTLEIAGRQELAKHLNMKDFSACLGYLLKHFKEICLYLYSETFLSNKLKDFILIKINKNAYLMNQT